MQRGEGSWVIVERKRTRDRKVARWRDLISVFVDNIPESTSAEQLRSVLSPFGRVVDSFIPASGRRGKGKCFGFVRFWERRASLLAMDSMNGSLLGGRRMVVNIAKYGWANKERAENDKSLKEAVGKNIPRPLNSRGDGVDGSFLRRQLNRGDAGATDSLHCDQLNGGEAGQRSFAEVVGKSRPSTEKCISVKRETISMNASWLSNNMVGEVKWEGIIPSILGLCEACGIRGVKVARLGSSKVLLTFSNLDESLALV